MRRSAFFTGRPGGLIREITWKGLVGQKAKKYRGIFDVFVLHLCLSFHFVCLSFPVSQNKKKSADKIDSGT
jgi:hypothetical protein